METATLEPASPALVKEAPVVSLLICTRNRAPALKGALDSVSQAAAHARDVAFELIVVDNGSTDQTQKVFADWAAGARLDARLIFEGRPGLSVARNVGMRAARGDIIAFTDDDCRLDADFLATLVKIYDGVDGPLFIGGRVELGDVRDKPITIKTELTPAEFDGLGAGSFIIGCNMAFNRAAMTLIGDMDERLGAGTPLYASEETDYIWRAHVAGVPLRYLPQLAVRHFHGRRTVEECRKLMHGYCIGNGALYAKYPGSLLARQLRWDIKCAVLELFGKVEYDPELGLSYRAKLWGNMIGIMRYHMPAK